MSNVLCVGVTQVLDEETFAILVLMALVTTFITTPTVMAIYKPARNAGRRRLHHRKLHGPSAPSSPSAAATAGAKELRVLACIHGGHDVPALINLIETIRGHTQPRRLVKLYILRMVELTERTSSILMARAARRNGVPFLRPRRGGGDQVDVAFDTYAQLGHVHVRPMTAVSALHTIHDDVAAVAEDKRVSLVVLPFHKRHPGHGHGDDLGPEWRAVNRRILREAPCSVAVLVDRGFGGGEQVSSEQVAHGVCVVFFGGPDDREALELAGRMAEHPGVQVTVVRFVDGKEGSEEHAEVTLRPSNTKNADKSYTFSTAIVDTHKEKVGTSHHHPWRSHDHEQLMRLMKLHGGAGAGRGGGGGIPAEDGGHGEVRGEGGGGERDRGGGVDREEPGVRPGGGRQGAAAVGDGGGAGRPGGGAPGAGAHRRRAGVGGARGDVVGAGGAAA